MRILIDGGSLQEKRLNAEKKKIIFHCLKILTEKEADTDWLLLVDGSRPQDELADLPIEKREVKSLLGGLIGRNYGYRRRVPSIVKQSRAGLLMGLNGAGVSRAGIPQCNWIHQVRSSGKSAGGPPGVPHSGLLFTFSEKDKSWLIEKKGWPADRVFAIYGGPGEGFLPLSWVEKEKARIGFAAGKEYFLTFSDGLSPEDLINILKAFSLFKKRQQSNMQLVFTGIGAAPIDFQDKLRSYKYRDDVHIRENLSGSAGTKLVGAAYAVISPFTKEATGLQVLNAFQAAIPVITSGIGCQAEVAGEAALYAEPGETAPLADRMMAVYKDEILRNNLIDKGKHRLSEFSWEGSAQRIWEGILYTMRDY